MSINDKNKHNCIKLCLTKENDSDYIIQEQIKNIPSIHIFNQNQSNSQKINNSNKKLDDSQASKLNLDGDILVNKILKYRRYFKNFKENNTIHNLNRNFVVNIMVI